ncbi:hypothetical protein RMSM_01149 [Rhodopirellula maiorica SM1]|uniref:Uncharacterized protein n=1 Tax=Rhodopirellula maiorica SM1 TaxID=1265738 RepID=M5RRG1_9BACT|nr:hypothetical protein [Rhodopirellula maiorica]EMI21928.1 hypothetical protein RMSM_01149 [Rhodopirellula maiorica SM1]
MPSDPSFNEFQRDAFLLKMQICDCPAVVVFIECLDLDCLPKDLIRNELLRVVSEWLPAFWRIDSIESKSNSLVTMKNIGRITVDDSNHLGLESLARGDCRRRIKAIAVLTCRLLLVLSN